LKDITLCMIIKNEEEKLRRSLESARKYFDSIVVIDTGSTDGARDTAVKSGCDVFDFAWIDDFSAARNFSISKAKNDWIFVLDSDEYFTSFDEAAVAAFVLKMQSAASNRPTVSWTRASRSNRTAIVHG
jgi:glycosyltransferase involved in cell wall biosynthesis